MHVPSHVRTAVLATASRMRLALDRDWTTTDVAQDAGYSRYYTVRAFRSVFGMPPIRYLSHIRVNAACHLLRNTTLSISMIGAAVGYPQPNSFSMMFHRMIGESPSAFRRRHV